MTSARSCRLRFVGLFKDGADEFLRQPVVACFQTLEERPNAGHETGALGGKQHTGEPGDCNSIRVGMGSAGRLVDQHQTAAGAFDRERQRTRLARIQVGERSQVAVRTRYLYPAARNRFGELPCARQTSAGQHFVADGRRYRDASKQLVEQVECAGSGESDSRDLRLLRRVSPPCVDCLGVLVDGTGSSPHHWNAQLR